MSIRSENKIAPAHIFGINIPPDHRELDLVAVENIKRSIKRFGLLHPLICCYDPHTGELVLIDGHHRLQALKELHAEGLLPNAMVDIIIDEKANQREARIKSLSANLHRADLTVMQRAEAIDELLKHAGIETITASDEAADNDDGDNSGQVAQKEVKRRGRKQSPKSRAIKKVGIERREAGRAEEVAGLSEKAKKRSAELGLDDNQKALLAAAKFDTPEQQVASLEATAEAKEAGPKTRRPVYSDDDAANACTELVSAAHSQLINIVAEKAAGDEKIQKPVMAVSIPDFSGGAMKLNHHIVLGNTAQLLSGTGAMTRQLTCSLLPANFFSDDDRYFIPGYRPEHLIDVALDRQTKGTAGLPDLEQMAWFTWERIGDVSTGPMSDGPLDEHFNPPEAANDNNQIPATEDSGNRIQIGELGASADLVK
jgi:ParB-like chromosome segregation protein Spo0J